MDIQIKKNLFTIKTVLFIFLAQWGYSQNKQPIYTVANIPWEEWKGNHRAELIVEKPADAVVLDLEWRRHDKNPELKRFIIVHEESGDSITNIYRAEVDNERCKLAFGPVTKKGKYHFYYLPYTVQEEYGFYNKGYLKREDMPDREWLRENDLSNQKKWKNLPKAKPVEFQARTEFDNFYPMEVIALESEKKSLLNRFNRDFLVFPEDRKFPIRMLDEIPQKWILNGPSDQFIGEAQKNEYYTFQLGIFAALIKLEDVKVTFSQFESGDSNIPAAKFTCFNTEGIGPYGKSFSKQVHIPQGKVQPLWIGVDIPEHLSSGKYTGTVTISVKNYLPQTIEVQLNINNKILADRGDSEAWRHSRLRWLNSTLGIDNRPTKYYRDIKALEGTSFVLREKKVTLSNQFLPSSLQINDREILDGPISFIVETDKGIERFTEPYNVKLQEDDTGIKSGSWTSSSESIKLSGNGTIEADGYLNYKFRLTALKSIDTRDIRLEIPFRKDVAEYMMGMDLPGTSVPNRHQAKWNGPHDSFWIGNTGAGIWCELRGSSYNGPLLNLYHPEYPISWFNNNKGGFKIVSDIDKVRTIVYSGDRYLEKGDEIEFEWSMLITPVRGIDYKSQFIDRYYHDGGDPMPSDEDLSSGVKIVNLHHANNYNPHINYPFIALDSLKSFVDQMHLKDQKVKIYHTIRELTDYVPEIWALRSLGNEILSSGRGGGYPWLREHLVENYHPQWYQWFPDKSADASILSSPGDSRWYNFYIESIAWLVKNVDIDGLYLDDVSFDRRTLKRIRKVLDDLKPGSLLDLHSNTGFSKGPATQYAEFFPFIDKLWFGESFNYNEMSPANWLVEVSGIPFGHMGDMLHEGGNPWRGMVYGMTVRYPWFTNGVSCDPRDIWKIWDQFGIADAKMIGYWEKNSPVIVDNDDIKATIYTKKDRALISIASWAPEKVDVKLNIDLEVLGLEGKRVKLYAPAIAEFQEEKTFELTDKIPMVPTKGWLLIIE